MEKKMAQAVIFHKPTEAETKRTWVKQDQVTGVQFNMPFNLQLLQFQLNVKAVLNRIVPRFPSVVALSNWGINFVVEIFAPNNVYGNSSCAILVSSWTACWIVYTGHCLQGWLRTRVSYISLYCLTKSFCDSEVNSLQIIGYLYWEWTICCFYTLDCFAFPSWNQLFNMWHM